MPSLLRLPAYRRLFSAQLISLLGDRIAPIAMAFAILDLTGSAKDLGIVLAAQTIPMALMLLPAGVIASRLPRLPIMLGSDLVRFGAQGATAALLIGGHGPLWLIAVLQALWGIAEAFFLPAFTALLAESTPSDELQPANAMLSLGRNATQILGPVIAAALIAITSPGTAVAFDAATFLVSASFLRGIPVSSPRSQSRRAVAAAVRAEFVTDLAQGARAVWSRGWVRSVILAFVAYHLTIFPALYVLGPVLARTHYDGAPSFAAWVAGFGVGALIGGTIALRFRPKHPIRWVGGGLAIAATQPLILGARLPTPAMVVLFAIVGAVVSLLFTIWDAELQRRIPADLLSRVSSFDFFGSVSLIPIGYALAGPLASAVGLQNALLGIGAFGVLAGLSTLLSPGVRSLERLERQPTPGSADLGDVGGVLPVA